MTFVLKSIYNLVSIDETLKYGQENYTLGDKYTTINPSSGPDIDHTIFHNNS